MNPNLKFNIMKKIFFLIVITAVFISCDKREYKVPAVDAPMYVATSERMTISELKTYAEPKIFGRNPTEANNNFGYLQNPDSTNVYDENDNRKIVSFSDVGLVNKHIKGVVVGDDESGNIYKQLYLQDETGAILLTVNLTGLFATYRVGQEVIVELDNLCIGKYYGAYQIGCPILSKSISSSGATNYGMSRMTPYYFYNCVHANGEPDVNKANDLLEVLTAIPASTESVRNTLVRFKNVTFPNGGTNVFAPLGADGKPATNSVKMQVGTKTIDVRTSGYSNFAGDTIPTGSCTVTAILSQYFDNLQITLRTRKDIVKN
jgi:hypothetical protein